MATEVTLPALGESVTEGTISRWLKEVGDEVAADEPLLEVSTDKVDTEIPAPTSGVLLEIKFQEDDVAEVGAVLAIIGNASEGEGQPKGSPDEPAAEVAAEPSTEQPAPDELDKGADQPKEESAAPAPSASGGKAEGTEITLPALGESVTEGTISRWLKEVGEQVEADEAIVEVSTDKVDTEIPAPAAGVLLEIRVKEDEVAEVGSVLGIIGDPSAQPAADAAPAEQPNQDAPKQETKPVEEAEPEAQSKSDSQPEKPQARMSDEPAKTPNTDGPRNEVAPRAAGNEDVYVTPVVRKMAADLGVDLGSIEGTGVGGRIRKQDVQAAADAKKAPAAAPAPAAASAPQAASKPSAPKTDESAKRGTVEKVPRLRKVIASRMTESLQTAAQLTATVEVDMTAISALRDKVKNDFKSREGVSLTPLAFITKAVIEGLKAYPKLNASLDLEAGEITYHDSENIGIAVDTERGLVVPVIKNAGDLNVGGIAKQIANLAGRVRNNEAGPDELSGATFTITNYGSAGTLFDTPIINQPNSAILGTGALVKRPVVVTDAYGNDTIAIRGMMYISMTYDHRLVDGADAARFLSLVKQRLEDGDFGGEFGQ